MLEVRTDRLIPLTRARQEIGNLINAVKSDDFYVITSTGMPKVALVDINYLGYLQQIEKRATWQERFSESLDYFNKKTANYSPREIKKDITDTIKKVRREKTQSHS